MNSFNFTKNQHNTSIQKCNSRVLLVIESKRKSNNDILIDDEDFILE